jgi:hypothetical protein
MAHDAELNNVELRASPRHRFDGVCRIAPGWPTRPPLTPDFVTVPCYNLARDGFGFLAPSPPPFTKLVAAFSAQGHVVYLAAHVVHCTGVLVYQSGQIRRVARTSCIDEPARAEFLVGCRFTRRLNMDAEGRLSFAAEPDSIPAPPSPPLGAVS